jgi:PAS domain S-box-containing protein
MPNPVSLHNQIPADSLLAAIIESSDDAIISKDLRGTVTSWNKGAERMFGYTAEEIIGQPIVKIIPPDREAEEASTLESIRRGERIEQFQTVRKRKDGSLVDIGLSISPIRDHEGRIIGASKIAHDITDRVRAEAGFKGFLESAPDAVVVIDAAGRIAIVNALTETLFGYSRDELLGKPVEMLVPDRYRNIHVHHRDGYLKEPRTRPMGAGQELSGRRKDGSEFPVEISLSPLRTSREGTLVISIIRDITERKQAEARFRGLLESAPDGIVVVDNTGTIVMINTQTEKMFGYHRDELLGQPVEILVPDQYHHSHVRDRDRYIQSPRTRPMGAGRALTGRKKDGTQFPVEISLSPLGTEQGTLITSIIRDITERRQADERIKASLREKEVLLKEIHHRVKNNLQVTSSLLKLQSGYIQDKQALEMFAESQNRIRSMALVHEKLYQSSDLSRINFSEYAEGLASLLFRSYGVDPNSIRLRIASSRVFLTVENAIPCGLILNELLSNAIKHAFPNGGGEIHVAVTEQSDHTLDISVGDTGVGLPKGLDLKKAETLGLHLVRTLTQQLNGELTVSSNGGTQIAVHFNPTYLV